MELDIVTLATVPGATAGAILVTQFVKVLGPDRWTGRLYKRVAAIVGVALLNAATIATAGLTISGLIIATLAGMAAGTAASATYDKTVELLRDDPA